MGLKSAVKQVAAYNNFNSLSGAFAEMAFMGVLAGTAGGLLAGGSTFAMLDGAEQGDKAGEQQVQNYRQKFAAFAEMETKIVKLKRVADASEMDALVGEDQSAAKQKYDRAKALIVAEQKKLGHEVYTTSQQMILDRNIPESRFDDLVNAMDTAVTTYALPRFLQTNPDVSTPYDSMLRECQIKSLRANGTTDEKVEAIVNCTDDKTDKIVYKYGFTGGAGLFLSWCLALGPLMAARRRRSEEVAAQQPPDDTITTNLKITYKTPKA